MQFCRFVFLTSISIFLCAGADSGQPVTFSDHDPRYHLQPTDDLEIHYRYTPEFDQTVTIQPDGKVSGTKVESGHALLAPAAQEAVSRWRFAPAPEASESEIDVNFSDGQ